MLATSTFMITSFVQSIMIARLIGLNDFGVLATYISFSVILSQLFDPRLLDLLIKNLTTFNIAKDTCKIRKLIQISLFFSIGALLLIIILVLTTKTSIDPFIPDTYKDSTFSLILILISTISITHFYITFQAYMRVKEMIKELSLISIFLYTIRLFAVYFSVSFISADILGVAIALSFVNSIVVFISIIYLIRHLRETKPVESEGDLRNKNWLKNIKIMSKKLYLTSLASIPQKELDISILSFFVRPESIGIYRMAKNFAVALWSLVDGIVLILFPDIAKLHEMNLFKKLKSVIRNVSYIGFLFSLAAILGVSILLPSILELILPQEYSESYYITLIMFTGSIIWLPLVWVYPLAISKSATNSILFSTSLVALLTCISYPVFAKTYGIYGAAIVYSLSPAILSIVLLLSLIRNHKLLKLI